MIELKNIQVEFSRDGASATAAVDDVSLTILEGEVFGIIGSSGAGKSTLVRTINLLQKPTSGDIVIDGASIVGQTGARLRETRCGIGMIFQHFNLWNAKTVYDNVAFPLKCARWSKQDIEERVVELLEFVNLEEKRDAYPQTLSGGQKQRVGIARALVQDPLLMLADEPIASLDPKSSRTVMEHLRWAADELGVACLANLHQVDFAMEFSDRIVALKKGRVVFDGAPHLLDEAAIADIYGTNEEAEAGSDFGERSVRQVGELSSSRTREADPERLGKAEAKDSSSPEVAA